MLGQKLGQILEKLFVPSRGHSFDLSWTLGQVGSKIRLLGQIMEKPCVYPRVHSFDPSFMKLCQNVNHHNI